MDGTLLLKDSNVERLSANRNVLPNLERFVEYCIYVFNPWWFTCPLAAKAPRENLSLVKVINNYAAVDKALSAAAVKAFNQYTWYLTGELIPLALWDDKATTAEKQMLADALYRFRYRYSFICQGTSTRRQQSDRFGLRIKLPPVITSLTTQR